MTTVALPSRGGLEALVPAGQLLRLRMIRYASRISSTAENLSAVPQGQGRPAQDFNPGCGWRTANTGVTELRLWRRGRELGSVPNRNDPDSLSHGPVEEPIGWHEQLPVWEIGGLGNRAAGIRKLLKTAQSLLTKLAEPFGRHGPVSPDIADRAEESAPGR